jgi:hypothetical protein
MSYGFAVYNSVGGLRVFDGSWVFKYHSTQTITAPAGGSTDRYVTGLNPDTWGFYAASATSTFGPAYAQVVRVYLYSGRIRVVAGFSADVTVTLRIFKA